MSANIALSQGNRLEAQRLLDAYYQQHKDTKKDPLILWLDAQTRATREERLEQLQFLVSTLPADHPYSVMAQETLNDEATYAAKIGPVVRRRWWNRRLGPVQVWHLGIVSALIGMIVILMWTFRPRENEIPALAELLTESPTPVVTALPDLSTPVNVNDYTLRYSGGILQIAAVEPDSQRIVERLAPTPIAPVPGARFYALKLIFECRRAICDEPPQADLLIRLDDRTTIPARDDVYVAGLEPLQPVALGRASTGWVVFEFPVSAVVTYLEIHPDDLPSDDPPPVILLPR
jgi:hypothetical protein